MSDGATGGIVAAVLASPLSVKDATAVQARSAGAKSASEIEFGPFRVNVQSEAPYRGDELVRLGNRALQILIIIAARAEEVVTKAELPSQVWPNTLVGEDNLMVHISGVRAPSAFIDAPWDRFDVGHSP